jgi:hypothetical protein
LCRSFGPQYFVSVNWKGVRLDVGQPIELYNLQEDLGETNNAAAKHAEIVARINALMKSAHTDSAEFPIRPAKRPGAG